MIHHSYRKNRLFFIGYTPIQSIRFCIPKLPCGGGPCSRIISCLQRCYHLASNCHCILACKFSFHALHAHTHIHAANVQISHLLFFQCFPPSNPNTHLLLCFSVILCVSVCSVNHVCSAYHACSAYHVCS